MTKSELIDELAEDNPDLLIKDIEAIVSTFFSEIAEALTQGNRIEIRGFGVFVVKHREARTGRNPRTGTSVEVPEKYVPFFKTGKDLRDRMNGEKVA